MRLKMRPVRMAEVAEIQSDCVVEGDDDDDDENADDESDDDDIDVEELS